MPNPFFDLVLLGDCQVHTGSELKSQYCAIVRWEEVQKVHVVLGPKITDMTSESHNMRKHTLGARIFT